MNHMKVYDADCVLSFQSGRAWAVDLTRLQANILQQQLSRTDPCAPISRRSDDLCFSSARSDCSRLPNCAVPSTASLGRTHSARTCHPLPGWCRPRRGSLTGHKLVQAAEACATKNGSRVDGRILMVREDREDRDVKRGNTSAAHRNGESSGMQVTPCQLFRSYIACGGQAGGNNRADMLAGCCPWNSVVL